MSDRTTVVWAAGTVLVGILWLTDLGRSVLWYYPLLMSAVCAVIAYLALAKGWRIWGTAAGLLVIGGLSVTLLDDSGSLARSATLGFGFALPGSASTLLIVFGGGDGFPAWKRALQAGVLTFALGPLSLLSAYAAYALVATDFP
jgi:hypothetical protein